MEQLFMHCSMHSAVSGMNADGDKLSLSDLAAMYQSSVPNFPYGLLVENVQWSNSL